MYVNQMKFQRGKDYLDYLGFEMVTLENYEEIYKGLLEV